MRFFLHENVLFLALISAGKIVSVYKKKYISKVLLASLECSCSSVDNYSVIELQGVLAFSDFKMTEVNKRHDGSVMQYACKYFSASNEKVGEGDIS